MEYSDDTPARPARHLLEPGFDAVVNGRKRILVTGSRTWPLTHRGMIAQALLDQWLEWDRPPVTLVHGGARGVDTMAADVFRTQQIDTHSVQRVFAVEPHLASWDVHGKAAGHIRNAEMVALGADVLLAFIHNSSRGATGCLGLAERAGIPVKVFRIDDGSTR